MPNVIVVKPRNVYAYVAAPAGASNVPIYRPSVSKGCGCGGR